jgi:competence protein ComEA
MSIRERLDQLSRGELAGLAIVVVATLLGAGLWYMRSLPRPIDIAAPADAVSPVVSPISGPTGSLTSAAPIIVDVAGWVRQPGVYEFVSGDRVIDAIDRAGGPRKDADLTTLNLAAPLMDGTQIVVP